MQIAFCYFWQISSILFGIQFTIKIQSNWQHRGRIFGNRLLLLFPHPPFFCWRVILFLTITLGFFQILEISFICSKTSIFIPHLIFFRDNCNKCYIQRCRKTSNVTVLYRINDDTGGWQFYLKMFRDFYEQFMCSKFFFILLCSNHSSFIGSNIKLDQSMGGNIKVVILVRNPSSLFDLHRQRRYINFGIVTETHNSSLHLIFLPIGGEGGGDTFISTGWWRVFFDSIFIRQAL